MMKISKMRLTCKCGNIFDAETVTDAPIAVALASMKAIFCPKCGASAKKLLLGGELPGKPDVSAPLEVRAWWWIENGDVGTSSKTFYGVFVGSLNERPDVPHDPEDFNRCRKLFDLIPEWRAEISKVTNFYPWLAPFVDHWDEMDRLFDEEFPTKRAPKLYLLMQQLRVSSLRIQYPIAKITTNKDGSLSSMTSGKL